MPLIVVPATPVVLTVVKLSDKSLPAVPVPAASSSAPSAAPLISSPSTCSVIVTRPAAGW